MKINEKQTSSKRENNNLDLSPEEIELKSKRLLRLLKKEGVATVTAISEDSAIDLPKEDVWVLIDRLRKKGFNIVEEKRTVYLKEEPVPGLRRSFPPITKKEKVEVLFMSDLCLGMKTQQGNLAATCLKIGEEREVFFNLIAGNLVAGRSTPTTEGEYFLKTAEEQADYVNSCFPRAPFNSFLLNGVRELSFRKEKDEAHIESLICKKRDDIMYLGDEKVVIPIGRKEAKVAVTSIAGAPAYTKSYPLQGVMEKFQEAVYFFYEHSEPFRAVIAGGLYSGILIPRQLPINDERFNDFDGAAIPSLHRITPSQTTRRRRGGSPVLGCLVLGANFEKKGKFKGFTYAFYDLTAYFKDNDYLKEVKIDESLSNEAKKLLLYLEKGPARYGELARAIRKSIPHVKQVLEELKNKDYDIQENEARKALELKRQIKEEFKPLDLKAVFKTKVRFLATSDWHVGHIGSRDDLIKKVVKIAEKEKVNLILNCGNVFEGTNSYDGQGNDLKYYGADKQRKHLFKILPKSKIPIITISSPLREHDRIYWTKCGHDIVDTFVEIAELLGYKIEYLGGPHGNLKFKDIVFDLQHPRGGLPYGQTYRMQRRIETLVSVMEVIRGAKATFIGHLHRAAFMLYKGMAGFLVPCLEDTTEYITSLDKMGELGVWVVEMAFDENKNLTKVELEYIPFEPKSEHFKFLDLDSEDIIKKWG